MVGSDATTESVWGSHLSSPCTGLHGASLYVSAEVGARTPASSGTNMSQLEAYTHTWAMYAPARAHKRTHTRPHTHTPWPCRSRSASGSLTVRCPVPPHSAERVCRCVQGHKHTRRHTHRTHGHTHTHTRRISSRAHKVPCKQTLQETQLRVVVHTWRLLWSQRAAPFGPRQLRSQRGQRTPSPQKS